MEKKFSIQESLLFGWEILKNNFWFIFWLEMIMLGLNMTPNVADYLFKGRTGMEVSLLATSAIFFVLQLIANLGMIKIFIGLHDKKEGRNIADLLLGVNYFFKYVLAGIVYGLIVLAGFILLIIPGIIWSIKYQFFVYFILDKNMSPMEALRMSAKITDGHKMDLFLFSCAAMVVNLIGFLALGIGLVVTIPVTSIALIYIFRKLSADMAAEAQNVPDAPQAQPEIQP
jgi:uncharacterized membrane protein